MLPALTGQRVSGRRCGIMHWRTVPILEPSEIEGFDMRLCRLCLVLLVFGCFSALPGCEWWSGTSEPDLTDLEDMPLPESEATAAADAAARSSSSESQQPQHTLQLNLKIGDRFPLQKTVVQTLTQYSHQGTTSSSSTLQMLLSITVEEMPESGERQGQKRMLVRYHRVRYSQDLGGKRFDYDSDSPSANIPVEAQGYRGLLGNGFSFWLGTDNKVVDTWGFDEFVERCVRHVIPERQQQVRFALQASSGPEGIANFVDDSIGILPPYDVKVGSKWDTERKVVQPLPMHVKTEYTLHEVDANVAQIAILGMISPVPDHERADLAPRDVKVSVRSGRCYGTCYLDRHSGLPIRSQVEQTLEMKVHLAKGGEFDQRKESKTTIESYLDQGLQQASAIESQGDAAVVPAGDANRGVTRTRFSNRFPEASDAAVAPANSNTGYR